MSFPYLTQAQAPLTSEIEAVNETGAIQKVSIPAERALTVYVDKRELVTLMTLGANPELLVLGYLRNQRLVRNVADIESITVDWDVGAAAVKTVRGIEGIEEKTAHRVVTTGCGQGSMFGGLMDEVDQIALPDSAFITQGQLYGLVNTIRLKETTYKSAGSVHACALFSAVSGDADMLLFVEDVGRHNAIDTIAGWMWMNMAPTLPASCGSLPLQGATPPEAAHLQAVQARAGGPEAAAFSPEGAAAPADRQSRICGPDWVGESMLPSRPEALPDACPAPELLPLHLGEGGGEGSPTADTSSLIFYTTGRLTSEMVIKSAQMGVPVVVSRSGITQMGHQVAQSVGLCAIGRATNKRFLCYTHPQRLRLEPGLVTVAASSSEKEAG